MRRHRVRVNTVDSHVDQVVPPVVDCAMTCSPWSTPLSVVLLSVAPSAIGVCTRATRYDYEFGGIP